MFITESGSYWIDTAPAPDRAGGRLPDRAEVVVVGAGIAGLTAAFALSRRGRSVLVLEANAVASGVSGNTTAKVTAQHALIYADLVRGKGRAAAATYGRGQLAAIRWIEQQSQELGIDCDFVRSDSYVYARSADQLETLRSEVEAAAEAGLPASFADSIDLPVDAVGAVRFADQAHFHPRKWLLGLADHLEAGGARILEKVRVTGVREGQPHTVETDRGAVRADHVVIATHYPILDRGFYFARLEPVRDLVVAGPVNTADAPSSMYLDADTHQSVRTAPLSPGQSLLIAGGEHYRVGDQVDVRRRFRRLAGWAQEVLGLQKLTHHWSAHDLSTLDRVPYVGRYHPAARRLWVATGFGQWGMTGGTAAGLLLTDLIQGRENPSASLYDPNRFSARSAVSLMRNNASVAGYLVRDYGLALTRSKELAELAPDTATVAQVGLRTVAAYRDPEGQLYAVSGRCTHLGCAVAFNNAEKSWDCPCHGSRFGLDGSVIQGPATQPLRRLHKRSDNA